MDCVRNWRPLVFALALASISAAGIRADVFGSVVAVGGTTSDIALDESRAVLYVANFGANRIEIMSTNDSAIHSSINVLPFPGAIALSSDARYLLVAHYCNIPSLASPGAPPAPSCTNAITSIDLIVGSQQVFSLASAPLGLAFLKNGQALVVTTTNFLLLDPASGAEQQLGTIANIGQSIAVPLATFPGQIVQAALSASADGNVIWGVASAGTASQFIFQYSGLTNTLTAKSYTSSPTLLPRISSAADGSFATVGYTLIGPGVILKGRYPNIIPSSNITGSVIDSLNGIIYAQYPDANQPLSAGSSNSGAAHSAMLILDADNLTFRDRILIPENMVGRAVLNAAATVLYAVSDSGVMVLPVGSLNNAHRVTATTEDLLVATNFCNTGALSQTLTITDPGGGQTDFAVTSSQPGVTILPASGVTPATVRVLIDPLVIPRSGGTTAIGLTLTSRGAVNQPKPVRLLINNPDPSQRGKIINQPGVLTDILPDAAHNRVYVLRQDMNQLQVFDGTTMNQIATLRTATTPTMMAMTNDASYLLVGHDDSQFITVYDLNTLQAVAPIVMPGGHFARSIAISNIAMLVYVRNEGGSPPAMVDSINFAGRTATALPTLGVYANILQSSTGVLAASPSGANILLVAPDGNVVLYSASANTFVASRHDFPALSGAFAASDFGWYVAGNSILNASLVPTGTITSSSLPTAGFAFVSQGGYIASAASVSAPGNMTQLASLQTGGASSASVLISEAPVLPTSGASSSSTWSAFGAYGAGSVSEHSLSSFTRTVAPLPAAGTVVVLSTSGLTALASSYPAQPVPAIAGILSAADGSKPVAPGGLISIYGQNMSPLILAASSTPLSTGLGNSCIGVNGSPIPLLYVSPQQINAQLPFNAGGNTTLTIHTPGGISNNYALAVQPTAPSVFTSGVAGPQTGIPLIVRNDNGQLVTPTNPLHPKDAVTIYLTGMGQTAPAIQAGQVAPASPLSYASVAPAVTLGGASVSVSYAGLAPGQVGVYQVNATVPEGVPVGLAVPLAINQGGAATTLSVRVVK